MRCKNSLILSVTSRGVAYVGSLGIFGCSQAFVVVVTFIFGALQVNESDVEIMNGLTWDASIL